MERKGKFKKCLEGIVIGATALATSFSPMARRAEGHASLIQEYWTTNNVQVTNNTLTNGTPYVLKLKLDFSPSDVATNKINSGNWQINVNIQYVNFATSSIPVKVDDFWGNYAMDPSMNRVDFTLNGTILNDNHRATLNPNDGPSGMVNYIESLYFTPIATATNTPLFYLGTLHFYDTSSHDFKVNGTGIYKLGTTVPSMNIVNDVPEPSTLAMLGIGGAALLMSRKHRRK